VIPADGFNPQKVAAVSAGIEATIGTTIAKAAVFDRDYRCASEVAAIRQGLLNDCRLVHIHGRKELENYTLVPSVLDRAIRARLNDRRKRTGAAVDFVEDIEAVLKDLTDSMHRDTQSQHVANYVRFEKTHRRGIADATLMTEALDAFEATWRHLDGRLAVVCGKDLLAKLNALIMDRCQISLSPGAIVRSFRPDEIPTEMIELVRSLDEFGEAPLAEAQG